MLELWKPRGEHTKKDGDVRFNARGEGRLMSALATYNYVLTNNLPGPDGGVSTFTNHQGQHAEKHVEVRNGRGYTAREHSAGTPRRNLKRTD